MPDVHSAISVATKPLPLEQDATIRERLSWVTDDPAEAYRIGAEEAQAEIVARLVEHASDEAPESS